MKQVTPEPNFCSLCLEMVEYARVGSETTDKIDQYVVYTCINSVLESEDGAQRPSLWPFLEGPFWHPHSPGSLQVINLHIRVHNT